MKMYHKFFEDEKPILDTMPITFRVNSNISESSSVLTFDCTEEVSAFDGLTRSCPK